MNAIKLFFGQYQLWITAIVVGVLLSLLGVQTVRLSTAQNQFAQYRAITAQRQAAVERLRADDERQARTTEQELRKALDDNAEKAIHDQKILTARVAALRDQLRHRPKRPAPGSPVAPVAIAPAGNTGAGLYREDSDFLVGDAAAAAQIVAERDICYAQYAAAREALKRGQSKK